EAVHGPMGPGQFHRTSVGPNAVWKTVLALGTSAAPITVTGSDEVTHMIAEHVGEPFPFGPFISGGVLAPPLTFPARRVAFIGGFQTHGRHPCFSIGIMSAEWSAADRVEWVVYLELGAHDPPPGCFGLAGPCEPENVVPPGTNQATGGAACTIS